MSLFTFFLCDSRGGVLDLDIGAAPRVGLFTPLLFPGLLRLVHLFRYPIQSTPSFIPRILTHVHHPGYLASHPVSCIISHSPITSFPVARNTPDPHPLLCQAPQHSQTQHRFTDWPSVLLPCPFATPYSSLSLHSIALLSISLRLIAIPHRSHFVPALIIDTFVNLPKTIMSQCQQWM
jgi:hypothetical protein